MKRVLYGANLSKPVAALELPEALQKVAEEQAFDLQAYKFGAAAEQFRAPRIVKIGLIQNAVVEPTTAPFAEQRQVGRATHIATMHTLQAHESCFSDSRQGAQHASHADMIVAEIAAPY